MGPRANTKKRLVFGAMTLVIVLVAVAVCGEILARFAGIEPWDPQPLNLVVEPGGRYFGQHPTLGYSNLPGSFTVTMPQTGLTHRVTHRDDTLRITRPLDRNTDDAGGRDGIWLFGMDPESVAGFLDGYGWRVVEHLGYDELAERYVKPTGRELASTPVERMVYAEKL